MTIRSRAAYVMDLAGPEFEVVIKGKEADSH